MKALLADADFRRVWLVGAMTGGLRWLELLVVGVYVLEQTGSASMVALMTVVRLAPMFLCGMPIGALADRYERQTLLMLGLVVLLLTSAVLSVLALTGQITLWQIAIGAFLSGIFFAGDYPVRRIMSGEIAGVDRLGRSMALESATGNATRMLGPALGGFLLETMGLAGAYLLGAVLYLISVVLLLRLAYRSARFEGQARNILSTLREGWQFVQAHRLIVGTLMVTVVVNFWGFAYITMVPVIGERVLGLSAFPIGVLMSIEGLGRAARRAAGRAVREAARLHPDLPRQLLRVPARRARLRPVSAWFPLSLALNLICGVSLAGFSVMQATIMFLAARPEVRSRVMGVLTVAIGAGPLGMLHLGWLADWLGAAAAVQIMALEGLVALALTALIWPETWRATELAPPPAARRRAERG